MRRARAKVGHAGRIGTDVDTDVVIGTGTGTDVVIGTGTGTGIGTGTGTGTGTGIGIGIGIGIGGSVHRLTVATPVVSRSRSHQPQVPGPPLNGPTTRWVIQPP